VHLPALQVKRDATLSDFQLQHCGKEILGADRISLWQYDPNKVMN
jgi:hypothetical protein